MLSFLMHSLGTPRSVQSCKSAGLAVTLNLANETYIYDLTNLAVMLGTPADKLDGRGGKNERLTLLPRALVAC